MQPPCCDCCLGNVPFALHAHAPTCTHPAVSRRYLLLQYNIIEEAATLQLWWVAHIVVRDLVVTLVGAGWWEWLLYSDMSPYKAKVRVCTRGCTMAREVGAAQSILPGRAVVHILSRGCGARP